MEKCFTIEEIVYKLREAEVPTAQGRTVVDVARQAGLTEHTYFRWRKRYGSLKIDQTKRSKDLQQDNVRLRRALSDTSSIIRLCSR